MVLMRLRHFLTVVRNFAEHANLLISVSVVSGLLLIGVFPRIGVAPVAAGTSVVASEVAALSPRRLVEGFLLTKIDSLNLILSLVLDGEDVAGGLGFLSGERFNGRQFDGIVEVQIVERLQVDDSLQFGRKACPEEI